MVDAKRYRPSNGSEGEGFEDRWCDRCMRDQKFRDAWAVDPDYADGADGCSILSDAQCLNIDDPNYPKEWIYGDDGSPKCTAFEAITDSQRSFRCVNTIDMFGANDV